MKQITALFLIGLLVVLTSVSVFSAEQDASLLFAAAHNKSDMRQAEKFLDSLPPACSDSYITTRSDGTVVIILRCKKGNDVQNGEIHIKNGVVKQVR